jgi:membrane glycosyltransferase
MNALVRTAQASTLRPRPAGAPFASLPGDAPLDMPAQDLRTAPGLRSAARPSPATFRLSLLIAATLVLTALAMTLIYRVLDADTIGPLDLLIMGLEAPLFAWCAFSFFSALAGFIAGMAQGSCALGLESGGPLPVLTARSAILLPIYNEAPRPVFSRLQAICESVAAAGGADHFDFFVLSDTTDPQVRLDEQGSFLRLKWRLGAPVRIFYRHRPHNIARKAGNVADWVRRFGGAYETMVVLDADSLMEGETLVRLAAAMERAPDIGLIQTAPAIVNRHTLFARAEQFASRLYGPMLARGVAWWSGSEGNYWGHNAIIRTAAFAAHAGLPELSNRGPFGGHIMSHDFVEAALLRRAGWRVCLAPSLGGSYEESPPTLAALLARDRRWCQGNVQHVRVLCAKGLHWVNRFHLLRGVSAYLVSPLWLSLLAAAALLPLRPDWGVRAGAPHHSLVGARAIDLAADGVVFGVTLGFLLMPKLLACLQMLRTPHAPARFGGAATASMNVLVETVLSTLVAPLIMISHTRSLASVLAGRDSGWSAQARDGAALSLLQTMRLHAADTVIGVALGAAALTSSLRSFVWMLPVVTGLTLAVPLAMVTAGDRLGRAARRAKVLLAPEEQRLPRVLARANALNAGLSTI